MNLTPEFEYLHGHLKIRTNAILTISVSKSFNELYRINISITHVAKRLGRLGGPRGVTM